VLCIDELHERGRTVLFATDPLLDATVAWRVVKRNDQVSMDGFLDELKEAGFHPEVVVTDGSPLYKETLAERWKDAAHQLCIFHVLRDAGMEVLRAVRARRDKLPEPKKYRPGRPKKRGRKRKKDDRRAFVTKHQHLVVKKAERWTVEDRKAWARMIEIDPHFAVLREFVERLHACFAKDITPRQARYRRTRLANDAHFTADVHLRKVIAMLAPQKFEKMTAFLSHPRAERTNNHVERNNRAFRLVQKTRYRRRRTHTIELAIWLHVCRRWRRHPKYGLRKKPQPRRAAASPSRRKVA